MAKAKFQAKVRDEDHIERKLSNVLRNLNRDTESALEGLGGDAELAYAAHALRDTGRMARGVKARAAGMLTVLVEVFARDPHTGFDYVGVTRFGHRMNLIVPSSKRRAASVVATKRRRARVQHKRGPAPALRLRNGDFRYSTRGFKPKGDWAEQAWPEVQKSAHTAAEKLGAKLIARLG